MKNQWLLVLVIILLLGAVSYYLTKGRNAYTNNPEVMGQEFCDCVYAHRSSDMSANWLKFCDSVIVAKSGYYKTARVTMQDPVLRNRLSDSLQKKAGAFYIQFNQYLETHCCDAIYYCPPDTAGKTSR